jgi:DNA topoisomerase-1
LRAWAEGPAEVPALRTGVWWVRGMVETGEVLKFDGFLKVYLESTDDESDDENSKMLPPLKVGENLSLINIDATERFTRPAPRYTEASLVKKLEELGIGRPSTYAPTIGTVQKRGYVVKEDREGKERNFTVLFFENNNISNYQLLMLLILLMIL